jgi:riboflavin synthase
MFTGIVEEVGTVRSVRIAAQSASLEIAATKVLEGTAIGDSILTDGVCLTVTAVGRDRLVADVMPETLRRTTLAGKTSGARVNLERALTMQSRLGGHLVAGHIDGVGSVTRIVAEGNARVVTLAVPESVREVSVDQGSVAVDGVSLTIVAVERDGLRVSLIPHTAAATTLGRLTVGAEVNLEADLLAKYVYAFLRRGHAGKGLTWDKLGEAGFV